MLGVMVRERLHRCGHAQSRLQYPGARFLEKPFGHSQGMRRILGDSLSEIGCRGKQFIMRYYPADHTPRQRGLGVDAVTGQGHLRRPFVADRALKKPGAAVAGDEEAATCRAEVAEDMTAREIAEAQRRARQWLSAEARKAA